LSWLWLIPAFPLLGAALNTAFGPWLQKRYGKRANHAIAVGVMVASCIVAEIAFWSMFARPVHERFFEDHLWTMWQSGSLKADIANAKAALKAFVVNRFGDFGFVIVLFILFWSLSGAWNARSRYVPEHGLGAQTLGAPVEHPRMSPAGVPLGPTVEFRELRNQIADESSGMAGRLGAMTLWGLPVLAIICICLFIGAAGKSAQIPLYVWLPDAM